MERWINVAIIVATMPLVTMSFHFWLFQRVHCKKHMLTGTPTASIGSAIRIVCLNVFLFVDCQKHVISCLRPCKENPDSLIFYTHESHLSIPAINVTKEYVIFRAYTSSHTSHTFQPLNGTIFGQYKTYYNACLNDWIVSNLG